MVLTEQRKYKSKSNVWPPEAIGIINPDRQGEVNYKLKSKSKKDPHNKIPRQGDVVPDDEFPEF